MSRPRPSRQLLHRTGTALVAVGASLLLVAGPLGFGLRAASAAPPPARATGATFVDLGAAAAYSVLAGSGVANTGATELALDLGLSPTGIISGFPPGTVNGTIHDKDAGAAAAQTARARAYGDAAGQEATDEIAGDQAGKTYLSGVHHSTAAVTNTGTITLDAQGNSSAVFIFQVDAALSSAAATEVVLANGALANNVFWQVVGAVSLGADAHFVGTFLAAGAISFGAGASLKGRALTPSTVGLSSSPITQPIDDLTAPVVTINGGASAATNDTTPTISGTTDEPAGQSVTVTVAGQTLSTAVGAGGTWAVSATVLTEGPHTVVASSTDASQNTGTATQVLTVDTHAPVVNLDGGATRATNDTTPTISGTSDAPAGTPVSVTVAGQNLPTTVGAGGAWSVDAAVLTETSHGVVASVSDAAGNTGTANQILTVDVTVPVLAIDGGPSRFTTDTSPWIYGTTAEQAGTVVHVTIGGQSLTATVQSGGTWGVSAQTLASGTYPVVASITDAAGNTGTATQSLQIGDVVTTPTVTVVPAFPPSRYKPDAEIRRVGGSFVGSGQYGAGKQTVNQRLGRNAKSVRFEVKVTNRGDVADRMDVLGAPRSKAFKVAYFAGGKNITKDVLAGTYRTESLKPGESVLLTVRITKVKGAKPGSKGAFGIRATSSHEDISQDTVTAAVKVSRG